MDNNIATYKEKLKTNIKELVNQNRLAEAKEILTQYEKIVKNDIDVYSIGSVMAIMEGEMEDAEDVLKTGLSIDSSNFNLLYNLAYAYQSTEQEELAIEYYKKAMQNASTIEDEEEVYKVLQLLGVTENKEEVLQDVVVEGNKNIYKEIETKTDSLNKMEIYKKQFKKNIEILIEQGLLKEAKDALKQYEDIVKDDVDIYSFKGVIAMLEGDMVGAEEVLLKGIRVNYKNCDLLYNLGYLYKNQGNYELSLYFYKKALQETNSEGLYNEINMHMVDVKEKMKEEQVKIQHFRTLEFQNRLNRVAYADKQKLIKKESKKDIHIVYVLTHVGICGGVKVIFEHANNLAKLGGKVTLVSHFPKPNWFPINTDYIMVPFDYELAKGIPDCDVIVATYWDHIQACIETQIAPVVYFEQGDFHLFDLTNTPSNIKEFIYKQFELPKFIITVSSEIVKVIKEIYNRDAIVFNNSVDEEIFILNGETYSSKNPYILIVGSDQIKFKGIKDILDAYKTLKKSGFALDLIWITPTQPLKYYEEVTKIFIKPDQNVIAKLYRGAFVYISASHYESFSLPVLEAMSCGCPVITTGNKGVREYTQDRINTLFIQIGNPSDIANKVMELLSNVKLRDLLIKNGLDTAKNYSWSKTIPNLLDYYKCVAQYEPIINNAMNLFGKEDSIMKNKKKIALVYTSLSGSNTVALYKLADQNIRDKYDISLVPGDLSNESTNTILNSDIAIFTEGNYPFNSKLSDNSPIVMDLWHGLPLKAMGYADKREKFKDLIKGTWDNVDYITSYSPFFNELMDKCISTDLSKYMITGAQRNDLLFCTDGRKNIELLFGEEFKNKKFVFYMPTYRYSPRGNKTEGKRSWENIFGFRDFNVDEFIDFLEKNDIMFFAKLHPAEESKFISKIPINKNIKIITNELLFKNGMELYETLNSVDVLITDYSSVYIDLLLLDIPTIFTPIDLEEYRKDRGILLEPYEYWTPGPKCVTQQTLQDAIGESLLNPTYYQRERKDILYKTHKYIDGNSSSRTWDLIDEISKRLGVD